MSNQSIKIFTIGFAGTTAEHFFGRLKNAGVEKIIDTRLWADTQLAGFAKKKNLPYFLKNLANAGYEHKVELAPSEDILKDFKNKKIDWAAYEVRYNQLLSDRQTANRLTPESVSGGCFLCSEPTPEYCHRRLLAEYLEREWDTPVEIVHL
ncbi:MAG: DUF488 domain-containing protein [Pseudomonadota bacterium]